MLVNEVSIKNFKSLKDINLSAKRVNLFIGEPNTGKSNLLEALSLFSRGIIGESFNNEIIRFENIGNLFYDNAINEIIEVTTDILKAEIEFSNNPGLQKEDSFRFDY